MLQITHGLAHTLTALNGDATVRALLALVDESRLLLERSRPWNGIEQQAMDAYRCEWADRYVHHSAAIAGSRMSELDVELVLENGYIPQHTRRRDLYMVKGIADGWAYAQLWAREPAPLTVDLVKRLHEVTALDAPPAERGQIRAQAVDDMRLLVATVKAAAVHPIVKTIVVHLAFNTIAPFIVCNGRTSRQLHNFMLLAYGYAPVAVEHDANRDDHHAWRQWRDNGDAIPCLKMLCLDIHQEHQRMMDMITTLRTPM